MKVFHEFLMSKALKKIHLNTLNNRLNFKTVKQVNVDRGCLPTLHVLTTAKVTIRDADPETAACRDDVLEEHLQSLTRFSSLYS